MFPLFVFGDIQSCSSYNEAGKYLTPYSVNVSGYTRRDGTPVRSYKRRPPGGVAHDEPYIEKRFWMGTLFIFCLIGAAGSIIFYWEKSTSEIKEYKEKKLKEEREKSRLILEKELSKKIEEERILKFKRQNHIRITLEEMKIKDSHFSELFLLPKNLGISNYPEKCKFCNKRIKRREFFIRFKAITKIHKVCPSCVEKREYIGNYQPSVKFIPAINYILNFSERKEEFIDKFLIDSCDFNFTRKEVEDILYLELSKLVVSSKL
jgi:hypothetical protein